MTKNIFLSVEFDKNKVINMSEEELAEYLALEVIESHDAVKNVQFRYGALGKVDKVHSVQ